MFENQERVRYEKNQLIEVICQIRFPTILTIGANEPVEFQEAVRGAFPRYLVRKDQPAPKMAGIGTPNPTLQPQQPVINYNFVSADSMWRLNLTNHFIALTCQHYTGWEEFARTLDQPLAHFIRIYKPAFFERVGLRYMNAFSRSALELEGVPWKDLIAPAYVGLLGEEDVAERNVTRCTQDVEMSLTGGCRLKLHSGPGMVRRAGKPEDKEVKWILDLDLSMSGNVPVNLAATSLQTLHMHAVPVFRGALTEMLHGAMEPAPL